MLKNQSPAKQAIQADAFLHKMVVTGGEKMCLSTLTYGQLGDKLT